VAYSNRYFYGDRLIVFPSPQDRREGFGVSYRHVDGEYKNHVNMREIDVVADAALNFMRRYPQRSLGIATMNKAQADVLDEKIDRLIAGDPEAEDYRERWANTLEPLFVKNLENVQGDERDAIFISTVYGPDPDTGRVYQRFGPINSPVGHRRLNVLFTRAKEQIVVFSSLKPGDILVSENSYQGLHAFAGFLDYAVNGRLEPGERTGRKPESPFEEWIIEALENKGYSVEPQVGVAGYFIDIGVRHPKKGDGFVLGVEADGASYHSSKSARDRDRLRQEVLESLGWEIHRVWSTDWFNNPQDELNRLVRHIEEAAARQTA
jgi:very-short-patch-repair endonuclease